jgi:hypothetical protein
MSRQKKLTETTPEAVENALEPMFSLDTTTDTPAPEEAPTAFKTAQKTAQKTGYTDCAKEHIMLAKYRGYDEYTFINTAIEWFSTSTGTKEQDRKIECFKDKYAPKSNK